MAVVERAPEHVVLYERYEAHMRARGLRPGTLQQRRVQFAALAAWLEPRSILTATGPHLYAFLDERTGRGGGPLSPRTRSSWLSAFSEFYRWAITEELIDRDPTATLVRPRVVPGLPRPIGEKELEIAVAGAGLQMRAWLRLGGWAGLRCGEIAGLTRDRVIDGEMLLRPLGKGNKERIVPMHSLVWRALRDHGLPTSGPLWVDSPRDVSLSIARYLRGLGIDATAHQLRHRFATRFHEECGDVLALADVLGHSSLELATVYARLNPKVARKAVNRIPGALPRSTEATDLGEVAQRMLDAMARVER